MDLFLVLLALACAPYMLARMLRMPEPPTPRALWAVVRPALVSAWVVVWPIVRVGLGLLGYGLKRAFAFAWEPTEEEKPALLRGPRYVIDEEGVITQDGQTDTQTDPVSAPDP